MGNEEFRAAGDAILGILSEIALNLFVSFFKILGSKISRHHVQNIIKSKLEKLFDSEERNLTLTREYGYCIAQIVSLIMTSKVGTYEERKQIIDNQIESLNSIMEKTILYEQLPDKLIYLAKGSTYDVNLYIYKYNDIFIYCTKGNNSFMTFRGNPIQTTPNVDGYYFILSLIECAMTDPSQTWEDKLNLLKAIENNFLDPSVDKTKPYIFQYNPHQMTLICTLYPYDINASLIIESPNKWYYITK